MPTFFYIYYFEVESLAKVQTILNKFLIKLFREKPIYMTNSLQLNFVGEKENLLHQFGPRLRMSTL